MMNSSLNNPPKSPLVADSMVSISSMPYTLPKDGWVSVYLKHNAYGHIGLYNNSTGMKSSDAVTQSGYIGWCIMFGSAGDVISMFGNSPSFIEGIFNEFK